jgi:transposase
VIDAIRYVGDDGVKWTAVPNDFGIPQLTVYEYFRRCAADGLVGHLRDQVREREGKNPRNVAVILRRAEHLDHLAGSGHGGAPQPRS